MSCVLMKPEFVRFSGFLCSVFVFVVVSPECRNAKSHVVYLIRISCVFGNSMLFSPYKTSSRVFRVYYSLFIVPYF